MCSDSMPHQVQEAAEAATEAATEATPTEAGGIRKYDGDMTGIWPETRYGDITNSMGISDIGHILSQYGTSINETWLLLGAWKWLS